MVYPVSYIWSVGDAVATASEHQLMFSRGHFTPVKGDEKRLQYMLAACSQVEQALTGRSLLIDLSQRLTATLQEHISARDRAVETLQREIDEQKAATDLRVREGRARGPNQGPRSRSCWRRSLPPGSRAMVRLDPAGWELQTQIAARGQQLLDACAEAAALTRREAA